MPNLSHFSYHFLDNSFYFIKNVSQRKKGYLGKVYIIYF